MKNDGGPAFPGKDTDLHYHGSGGLAGERFLPGMSLRDWFAGQALPVLLEEHQHNESVSRHDIAEWAYRYANAMIEKRETEVRNDPSS